MFLYHWVCSGKQHLQLFQLLQGHCKGVTQDNALMFAGYCFAQSSFYSEPTWLCFLLVISRKFWTISWNYTAYKLLESAWASQTKFKKVRCTFSVWNLGWGCKHWVIRKLKFLTFMSSVPCKYPVFCQDARTLAGDFSIVFVPEVWRYWSHLWISWMFFELCGNSTFIFSNTFA